MTKPMTEPSVQGDLSATRWRVRQLERRPGLSPRGQFDIKMFADDDVGATGYTFTFMIPLDLGGTILTLAEAFVIDPPASDVIVMVHNLDTSSDMLIDPLTIDAGDLRSFASAVPVSIDPVTGAVTARDLIQVQVLDADGTAMGLGVILDFV